MRIFTWATAAAPFSRSAKTARFLSSPRSNRVSPPITWPLARTETCFVTGPTTSSFDSVYKIDAHGSVSTFYRGLGRPQGLAFDVEGNLYVAASLSGKRGIVKITPDAKAVAGSRGPRLGGSRFCPGPLRRTGHHRRRASPPVGYSGRTVGPGLASSRNFLASRPYLLITVWL